MSGPRLLLVFLAGGAVVAGSRLAIPQAPPMYEGAFIPPPYRYCSPPPNLASSNTRPAGGGAELTTTNGVNKLGTAETADAGGSQVVAFFAQGVFKSDTTIHVTIQVRCSGAPPPPPHSTLVGNDYLLQAYTGASPGAAPPLPLLTPAQVLMRVPPVPYNTVRAFYDGSWHDTQFGAQTDLVNISLDRLGDIAAFNDTSLKKKAQAPATFSFATIFEAGLTVIAVLIIAAGIIAQRRRTAPAGKTPDATTIQGSRRAKGTKSRKNTKR